MYLDVNYATLCRISISRSFHHLVNSKGPFCLALVDTYIQW